MKKYLSCLFLLLFLFTGCAKVQPYGDSTEVVTISDGYIFDEITTDSYGLLSCDNNAEVQSTYESGTTSSFSQTDSQQKRE